MDDLARDAAELTLAHWPEGLILGRGTTEKLLRRATEYAGPERVASVLLDRSTAGGSAALATELVLLGPLREALSSPAGFADFGDRLPTTPPALHPEAAEELAEMLGEALGWVGLAGADAPRALLGIAALMDGANGAAADRERAVDLARELLLPRLLDRDADPVAAGWPPMPPWLWDAVAPALVPVLDIGRELPGQGLSAATHQWLDLLSIPRGELTLEALQDTGPVEWERAAFRVLHQRPRPGDLTPLERAATFLATVHSSAANENKREDYWTRNAAEVAYSRNQPLDLPEAMVLMAYLPGHMPLTDVLTDVLARCRPSTDTAAAVARLRQREDVPARAEAELARHEHGSSQDAVLVTDRREIIPLTSEAVQLGSAASGYASVAEAMLRVDTTALPLRSLASFLWEPEMPWELGFQLLAERHPDPATRVLLAAHLICRGARAGSYPQEDQAAKWLAAADKRGISKFELAAAELLAGMDDVTELILLVERVVADAARKPRPLTAAAAYGREGEHPDDRWRAEATSAARRVIKRISGSHSPAPGRRHWTVRADRD